MEYRVTIRYDIETTSKLARRAYWRTIGRLVLPLCVISGLAFAWSAAPERGGWFAGVMGATFALCVMVLVASYQIGVAGHVQLVRKMTTPEAEFGFGGDAFAVTYGLSHGQIPWSQVTKLWRYPEGWLLFVDNYFYTLPLADLGTDVQDYILNRVRAAGAKIA